MAAIQRHSPRPESQRTHRAGHRQRGITLISMLVAVAVIAMVLGSLPALANRLVEWQALSTARTLTAMIRKARHISIMTQTSLTLCASPDGQRCGERLWRHVLLRDDHGVTLAHLPIESRMTLLWRGTAPKLSFKPQWRNNLLNGTFTLCLPPREEARPAWRVIVNRLGRPRLKRQDNDPRCPAG